MARIPWNIDWSENMQQLLYKDCGKAYYKKGRLDTALKQFDKAYKIKPDDVQVLLDRSLCQSDLANSKAAYEDALAALNVDPSNHVCNLRYCDTLYNEDKILDAIVQCYARGRLFKGSKKEPFDNRCVLITSNILDALGDASIHFFIENAKKIPLISKEINKNDIVDPRPLWKILREENKCDVLSIPEIREEKQNPRERSRREQNLRVFTQIYFKKGHKDHIFLQTCAKNKDILSLPLTKATSQYLERITQKYFNRANNLINIVHARGPIYSHKMKMEANVKYHTKLKEEHLYRIQYQTRRDMFKALEVCRKLREKHDLHGLLKYVEPLMGIKMSTKTLRVMPRMFEFYNEIYNIVALTYIDRIKIPKNLNDYNIAERLFILLDLQIDKEKLMRKKVIFGDRSTYFEPGNSDYAFFLYKKKLNNLEERLLHCKITIEKCYLLHEIVYTHIKNGKIDEARSMGKKVIDEANICNSCIYMTLGALALIKCDVIQRKVTKIKESMINAAKISAILKEPRINEFFELCIQIQSDNTKES